MYDDKEKERGLQKGDKKEVFKYSAESELSSQLMEDLKNRCHQTKEKVERERERERERDCDTVYMHSNRRILDK